MTWVESWAAFGLFICVCLMFGERDWDAGAIVAVCVVGFFTYQWQWFSMTNPGLFGAALFIIGALAVLNYGSRHLRRAL